MKKNSLLFLIIVILCSGCTAQYNLDIDNINKLREDVNLSAESSYDVEQIANFNRYVPIDYDIDEPAVFEKKLADIEYYKISKSNDSTNMDFRYTYNLENINRDMIAKSCFEYVTVMNKEQELLISTSNKFLCFGKYDNLDGVEINLISKYKLKETNADSIDGHKYTWFLNKGDSNDKYIYLLLDTSVRNLTLWERILEGEFTNIFTVSIVLFVIGFIIYSILKRKGEIKNKI